MSDNKTKLSSEDRRKAVRNILAGTGVVAGVASSPTWVKPAIDAIVLPAHAQTSGPLVFPKVLVGGITAGPIVLDPTGRPKSILDMFVEPAYADIIEPNLENACLSMDIPDDQSFALTLTFANDEPIVVMGTISAGVISGESNGVTVSGMVDLDGNTAAGIVGNSSGRFEYELDGNAVECIPMATTTTMTPTTTVAPFACPQGYSTFRYGSTDAFNNYYFPYDYNGNNGFSYGYSCFDDSQTM